MNNRFAEIKQYKHKMLQHIFFFVLTFGESTCPLNKKKVKEIYRNKQVTKTISNHKLWD